MYIQCNMIFRIFGKAQNCAKTIVIPNGPKLSLSAGHHPYYPTGTRQVWTRVQYPKCAYDSYRICIGLWSETARNGQYKRLTEKMRVMGRKKQGLNTPEFHSSA